ncbi:hypothetical protein H4R99_007774 [Coemansia sp. RSA 1722]|nr:hypothetical protein H4R99_007774 [Coemansia sp. RSA 1722]KAJ2597847.1 hypothetical protein GGF39_002878 [Coemansia sp. RSA 1721]KAJ2705493.1 hypothetical protein FB645_002379 [Coemansia sp. IMI 203386]
MFSNIAVARKGARPTVLAALLMLFLGAVAADTVESVTTSDGGLALNSDGGIVASGIIAGIVLIVIGFLFNYFGYKLAKVLVFLAGFCVIGGLVLYAEYKIRAPREDEKGRQVWYLAIAAVFGLIGGGLAWFFFNVGIALVGALGGFALATWILAMKSGGVIHSDVGRIIFIVAMIIVGMLAALFLKNPAIIVLSSIWGSYALFVGIDCFARTGFQYTALDFLNTPGAVYETSPKVYAMIAAMAVSALLGIIFQFVLLRKSKGKANHYGVLP